LKLLGFLAIGWLAFTTVLGGAMLYYRSGWLATADVRQQNEELRQTTARVEGRLSEMEQVVDRANRLATRLETAVGINGKTLTKGVGPIAEDDLPDPKKLLLSSKRDLKAKAEKETTVASFDDLELKMEGLDDALTSVEMRLQEVYEFHQGKLAYWASVPSIWPVRGWVTSDFGVRRWGKKSGVRFHEGIDIAAHRGTPVHASGDGIVTYAGYKHGLGKVVIIDHGFGITSIYGHNSTLYVQEGQRVKRGSGIATVGSTGRSTGPHLHYQVEVDGVPVDPMRYIIENF
jgi:murein DD-endopeptidase MepM/ murein hydrolase activator NlpD